MTAPSAYAIEQVLSIALAAEQRMRADAPEDEDFLAALTAEGADVSDILRRLARAALDAKASGDAADKRVADLRQRRARFDRQEEAARGAIFAILDALGLSKFADPEFTATVSAGRPVAIVTDESLVPESYWRTTRAIDKAAINADLKEGVVIAGVEMTNSMPTLRLLSK